MAVRGLSQIQRNLARIVGAADAGAAAGLVGVGLAIRKNAQQRVPVDTAFLKSSAFTHLNKGVALKGPSVRIGFSAAYAGFVHENLTAHHNVGEAKYLEKAVRDIQPQIAANVGVTVREATKREARASRAARKAFTAARAR